MKNLPTISETLCHNETVKQHLKALQQSILSMESFFEELYSCRDMLRDTKSIKSDSSNSAIRVGFTFAALAAKLLYQRR